MQEPVALAKSRPGSLATPRPGTAPAATGAVEILEFEFGLQHLPETGKAPAPAIVVGVGVMVPFSFSLTPLALPQAGALRLSAITLT